MNEYLKRKEESITSYSIRLYKNRKNYGLTFQECGDLLNEVSGEDFSEAKWRRPVQHYLEIQEYLEQENPTGVDSDVLEEIELEKIELQKQQIRMRDQKRLMNTKLRELARLEHLENYLKETVEEIEPVNLPVVKRNKDNDKVMLATLSDWHIGADIDNIFNKFNNEVAKERISKYKSQVIEKMEKENIKKIHIVNLGDSIMGHIHVTARIEAEQNAIEQIIKASQYFEEFIKDFVLEGYDVTFLNIGGNHNRIIPNKKDSLGTSESFERLVTVYLNKAFGRFNNYKQIDDEYGIIQLEIKNKKVVCAHGDMDYGVNVVSKVNELLNDNIDYLFTGHVHNAFYKEYGKATHIGIGSLMGADSYATYKRYSSRPSQSYFVFDDNGIDEMKIVYLD